MSVHPHTFGCPICLDTSHMSKCPPDICMPPVLPCTSGFPIWYWDGGICTAHMFGVLGASTHLSDILVPASTSIVSHFSCCPSLLVASLLSQASTSTAMTTTTPVTVVSSSMSSLSLVTMAPFLMGLPAILGQDVVLPQPLTPKHSGSLVGLATVPQQQPPSQIPLQAYANYAIVFHK